MTLVELFRGFKLYTESTKAGLEVIELELSRLGEQAEGAALVLNHMITSANSNLECIDACMARLARGDG